MYVIVQTVLRPMNDRGDYPDQSSTADLWTRNQRGFPTNRESLAIHNYEGRKVINRHILRIMKISTKPQSLCSIIEPQQSMRSRGVRIQLSATRRVTASHVASFANRKVLISRVVVSLWIFLGRREHGGGKEVDKSQQVAQVHSFRTIGLRFKGVGSRRSTDRIAIQRFSSMRNQQNIQDVAEQMTERDRT